MKPKKNVLQFRRNQNSNALEKPRTCGFQNEHAGSFPESNDVPVFDLNERLLDHPAASFVFRQRNDLLIVDRAARATEGSLVITEKNYKYRTEAYHGQPIWGVITYRIEALESRQREARA